MKQFVLIFLTFLSISCNNSDKKLKKEISDLELKVSSSFKSGNRDTLNENKLLDLYSRHNTLFPNDTMNVKFLFASADIFKSRNEFFRAVGCYFKVYQSFPNSSQRPMSLFMQGFLYENELRDFAKAKEKYELFLSQFPSHPLKKDIEFSLKHLGKTPEQILEEITSLQTDSIKVQ